MEHFVIKAVLRTAGIAMLVLALLLGAVGSLRWAKRGGTAAKLTANALMLGLGMGFVVHPPQRGVEQAEALSKISPALLAKSSPSRAVLAGSSPS